MTLSTNDVQYGPPNFIVDAVLGRGTHQTIAAAIASASFGETIYIRPGTYTENLSLKDGVTILSSHSGRNLDHPVIVGKCTLASGTAYIIGLNLTTNGDYAVSATSTATINMTFCTLTGADNTVVEHATSGDVRCDFCVFGIETTGISLYDKTGSGVLYIRYASGGNSGVSVTASDNAAGIVRLEHGNLPFNFTSSVSGRYIISHQTINSGTINQSCLITSGTGTHTIFNSNLTSGTASTLSVGSGTTVTMTNSSSSTSNASALTGAGTLNYGNLSFDGSSSVIDVTTLVPIALSASDTIRGDATFDENDFLVTSGDVTLANRTRLVPGYVENLGIDYNGGTGVFTVQGAQTTLATTNPGFVTLQSRADPGELTTHEITTDQSFIDDVGVSEIINNLFGLPTGVAYGEDIPFYLYAVTNNAESAIAFMISRVPGLTTSPAAADIGAPDDAVSDNQYSFFSIENIDETLFGGNPCLMIGSFRMQFSASDDWTAQALSITDGIGQFQEEVTFDFPVSVFGAATGSHILSNGGTAPIFTTNNYNYIISRTGNVTLFFNMDGDGGADGAGAVTTFLTIPYVPKQDAGSNISTIGDIFKVRAQSATTVTQFCIMQKNTAANNVTLQESGTVGMQNADFSAGARFIRGVTTYHIQLTA